MERFSALAGMAIALVAVGSAHGKEGAPLRADLDGDGKVDTVVLTQSPAAVVLEVQLGTAGKPIQRLEFGVDPARQNALCKLPAVLESVSLVCDPMEEPLAGCKAGNGAHGLLLSDGECDPIQLYWNHDTGELDWWRL